MTTARPTTSTKQATRAQPKSAALAQRRSIWSNLFGLFGNLSASGQQARRHAIRAAAAENLVGIGGV